MIEAFYRQPDDEDGTKFTTEIDMTTLETTTQGVRGVLVASLPSIEVVGPDEDLFYAGLESLLAFRVVKCLRSAITNYNVNELKKSSLVPRLVYTNPTINKLSAGFYGLLHETENGVNDPVEAQNRALEAFRARYTADLPLPSHKCQVERPGNRNIVILTGSTGSLGSYILESLLKQKNVDRIYCLNRAEDGKNRQTEVS